MNGHIAALAVAEVTQPLEEGFIVRWRRRIGEIADRRRFTALSLEIQRRSKQTEARHDKQRRAGGSGWTNSASHSAKNYPTQRRAFLKICIQGESSPEPGGDQDIWTLRNTRSGCGMTMVKRPSGVVRPVMPPGEPLGL